MAGCMSDAPSPRDPSDTDHTRAHGGSPANLFTHGRTGADLHDAPASVDEAQAAGEDDGSPSADGDSEDR